MVDGAESPKSGRRDVDEPVAEASAEPVPKSPSSEEPRRSRRAAAEPPAARGWRHRPGRDAAPHRGDARPPQGQGLRRDDERRGRALSRDSGDKPVPSARRRRRSTPRPTPSSTSRSLRKILIRQTGEGPGRARARPRRRSARSRASPLRRRPSRCAARRVAGSAADPPPAPLRVRVRRARRRRPLLIAHAPGPRRSTAGHESAPGAVPLVQRVREHAGGGEEQCAPAGPPPPGSCGSRRAGRSTTRPSSPASSCRA